MFSESRAVYEIMWDYLLEPDRPQMTIKYIPENTLFSCRVKKTKKTPNSEYIILLSQDNNGYAKPYECYVHGLSCLFSLKPITSVFHSI